MFDSLSPHTIQFKDYSIKGVSTAGIGTCVTIPEWKLCFDVAQGLPFAFPMNYFFISHLHQDHASGIPYIISQKAMQGHKPPCFFVPPGTSEPLAQIMNIWSKEEGHAYDFELKELPVGQREPVYGNLYVESFKTKHRVKSQGYVIYQKGKKLNPKYEGLSESEILKLKRSGQVVDLEHFAPRVAFTGDTQIEFLDLSPHIREVETLIMEITYIDEKKPVEAARKWGHIHFSEFKPRVSEIKSKNIIWIHLSARYSRAQAQELIDRELSNEKERIHILVKPLAERL